MDVGRPSPGPGQRLVAVRAAGVNPGDRKPRTGFRRPGGAAIGCPRPPEPLADGREAVPVA